MRILKNKSFSKWSKEEGLKNTILLKAADEIEQGLFDANLGGHIYKKRVPLDGKGKSGGARVLVAFKQDELMVFIYGFSKNQKGNITDKERDALKALARIYFSYSEEQLDEAIIADKLIEVI